MYTAPTLTHAAETTLSLITAAATQRRSRSALHATATLSMAKSRTKVGNF